MDEKRKRMGALGWTVVAVVGLLIAYPLSAGPVIWLWERGVIAPHSVMWMYAPLDGPSGTWIGDLYDWYLSLWGRE